MNKEDYPYITTLNADFKLLNNFIADIEASIHSSSNRLLKLSIPQYSSSAGIPVIENLWDRNFEWFDDKEKAKETALDKEIFKAITKGEKDKYLTYAENIFQNQLKHIKLVVPERLKRFTQFYHESWVEFLNHEDRKNHLTEREFVGTLQFIMIATFQSLEEQFSSTFESYRCKLPLHITKYDSDYIKPIRLGYGDNNDQVLDEVYSCLYENSKIYISLAEFKKHFVDGEHPKRINWFGTTSELVALFNGVFSPKDPIPLKWLLTTNDITLTICEHFNNRYGARIPPETVRTTIKRGPHKEDERLKDIAEMLRTVDALNPS